MNYLSNLEFEPFILSFKLALTTTIILFIIALPLAWYLSQTKSKIKPVLEALTALPIVLPPSVLGFYLLYTLSLNSPIGNFFNEYLGIKLVFNFTGLVVASCFYSLPFMVQPLQSGFESLNKNMLEASYISGKSKLTTLFFIALPNIKPALLTAIIITFAHTVGEFGVVLMVGGSIPAETKVASVAIYEYVEILDYVNAHIYSAIMLIMSFIVLFGVYIFNAKQKKTFI
ncbi:molybdate ABC transporter permease subunit [Poseidonibacter ostreae]|jgi:molybdate transport system permease protein|uniref:Molybdenum transport system permease n=1 Tax=Poseidonibacter ostreae TaxID=2654171 RepID=A0A6L4WTF1_9BACT|nr:molybdate ABC transporter permease subunit [Poseidonibacter ostreae]KAB7887072.1 molybdate ABC transporter permease subunit [Poseidonibacter ostreae]KAB7889204.1 molybdate ABC transporter permease subunit [Poseidonibacter ostreae]KAB7891595.1 molybdate ABC transporter permease subunit [Poseidonibacter ostreae]MAC84806.1 molybdate ABC transporter permease subunit [Arcobacter sp.]|tara:strand:+ start:1815 stop:2501 length:687 start_codon:yes stop_codon:yes gene_type:complete